MNLLDVALSHLEAGRRVLPTRLDKSPACGEGWDRWFREPQNEADIKQLFGNGAFGIGILLHPASSYVVLDFDGPHARAAWGKTGIELPLTARMVTHSGGEHLYFRMPDDAPPIKRKVRLVTAECACSGDQGKRKPCGVDLLVHGYSILPPTPGYAEDPDHPLEDSVPIPAEILDLAVRQPNGPRRTGNADGRVPDGQRKVTACSLAGTMRARGMSIEAIRAALKADSESRFDPPLDDSEIEDVLRSASGWKQGGHESQHLTDLGNGRRFAWQHCGQAIFSEERRCWSIWDEKIWQWDKTRAISDLAEATVRSIYEEAAAHSDKAMREAISNHAVKSESRQKIEAMLALAQGLPEIRIALNQLDKHSLLFNATNCTLDLGTLTARVFRREDYMTKISPVVYDPEAQCPRWEKFLMEVTDDDAELAAFLQRSVGYSLTGSTKEQCFWLLSGNGSNGKTTFVETVLTLMGDYGAQIKTDVLLESRYEQKDYHLAELHGKRFVAACESNMGRRMAAALMKQATGGERINARSPYGRPFSYYPEFKIWLSTNHRPRVTDPSAAMWRRIYCVPFNVEFVKREEVPEGHPGPFVDRALKETLCGELSGILNWALEGCRGWQRMGGLCPPKSVLNANKQYREEEDVLGNFLRETYEFDAQSYEAAGDIYKKYVDWCKENGEHVETNTAVGRALTDKGFRSEVVKREGKSTKVRWGLKE